MSEAWSLRFEGHLISVQEASHLSSGAVSSLFPSHVANSAACLPSSYSSSSYSSSDPTQIRGISRSLCPIFPKRPKDRAHPCGTQYLIYHIPIYHSAQLDPNRQNILVFILPISHHGLCTYWDSYGWRHSHLTRISVSTASKSVHPTVTKNSERPDQVAQRWRRRFDDRITVNIWEVEPNSHWS